MRTFLTQIISKFHNNATDQVNQKARPLLPFQDQCAEFRDNMKNGKLSCTRESDPVRDASGKMYNNKCSMCKEIL